MSLTISRIDSSRPPTRSLAVRRDEVQQALREQGWRVPVSQGNFVWLPTGPATAAAVAEAPAPA